MVLQIDPVEKEHLEGVPEGAGPIIRPCGRTPTSRRSRMACHISSRLQRLPLGREEDHRGRRLVLDEPRLEDERARPPSSICFLFPSMAIYPSYAYLSQSGAKTGRKI